MCTNLLRYGGKV
uniref:Uncharacterized protein n=1 Tax=Anguilla anguilla TaxID=7936 RepID=A0A0E9Q5K4_ANGAN